MQEISSATFVIGASLKRFIPLDCDIDALDRGAGIALVCEFNDNDNVGARLCPHGLLNWFLCSLLCLLLFFDRLTPVHVCRGCLLVCVWPCSFCIVWVFVVLNSRATARSICSGPASIFNQPNSKSIRPSINI